MKAYVIKNKEGEYCQISFNGWIGFASELYNAYIYHSKQGAEGIIRDHKSQLGDCEVVEITIIETKDLEKDKDKEIEELKERWQENKKEMYFEYKKLQKEFEIKDKELFDTQEQLQQIRHQVCEEIREKVNECKNITWVDIQLILDQIEKGESGKE